MTGQLIRFAMVGVASTFAYVVLFLLLRYGMGAQAANSGALLLTTIGNTAANRRVTFGVHGRTGRVRHQAQGLAVFGLALLLTSGSLALLGPVSIPVELTVLIATGLLVTGIRFTLLRSWVFRR